MAQNKIRNRKDFIKYCLRSLGEPVVRVNLDVSQIEDCVNDALDMFWEYHTDGQDQQFRKYQITKDDLDRGEIFLGEEVLSVQHLFPPIEMTGKASTNFSMGNLQYQAFFSDLISRLPKHGGVSSYMMNMQYLNTINDVFNAPKRYEYSKHKHTLYIHGGMAAFSEGDWIAIECVVLNDPEKYPNVWSNWWLKQYATALIKKRWGTVLGKYSNVPLPSGVTLNGEAIRSEANQEIADLEERLRNEFQEPTEMYMG